MERGSYKSGKINFAEFRVMKFTPHLFSPLWQRGCGGTALATLTGIHPLDIPLRKSWSDKVMTDFLRQHGLKAKKITVSNLTRSLTLSHNIGRNNVMLISSMFSRGQASWYVLYNEYLFHNFEISSLTAYEFINRPILSAYLLMHPSWNVKLKKLEDA